MAWMGLAEAAVAMGTSVRTVYRRIDRGELEIQHEGRRTLVHVDVPTNGTSPGSNHSLSYDRSLVSLLPAAPAQNGVTAASAMRAFEETASRARRSARFAWCWVAALAAVLGVGAWHAHQLDLDHQNDVARATGRAESAENDARVLTGDLDTSRQALAALQVRVDEKAGELSAALARLEAVGGERDAVKRELAEARQALTQEQQLVADLRAKVGTLTAEHDRLAQDAVALRDALGTERSAADEAQGQVAALTAEYDRLCGEADALRGQLDEACASAAELEGRVASVSEERDRLAEHAGALQVKHDADRLDEGELKGQVLTLTVALERFAGEITSLRDKLAAEQKSEAELRGKLEVASGERDGLLKEVSDHRDRWERQQAAVARVHEEIASLRAQREALAGQMKALEKALVRRDVAPAAGPADTARQGDAVASPEVGRYTGETPVPQPSHAGETAGPRLSEPAGPLPEAWTESGERAANERVEGRGVSAGGSAGVPGRLSSMLTLGDAARSALGLIETLQRIQTERVAAAGKSKAPRGVVKVTVSSPATQPAGTSEAASPEPPAVEEPERTASATP